MGHDAEDDCSTIYNISHTSDCDIIYMEMCMMYWGISFSMLGNKPNHTLFKSCSFTYLHPWLRKTNLCSPRA